MKGEKVMNETLFKEILGEFVKRNYAEFDNAPEHKFSLKHRLAMKHIFSRYERNVHDLRKNKKTETPFTNIYKPHTNLKQRLIIVTVIVILMTLLVGWVVVFVSGNFRGTVYKDRTQLFAVNLKNSPQAIEYKYALVSVPEGFEMTKTDLSPIHVYTLYTNNSTKQTITLRQWVKSNYEPNYNTEKYQLENIQVNNNDGLCMNYGDDRHSRTILVWDNGDYIIEVLGDLTKEDIMNLSKINKIK